MIRGKTWGRTQVLIATPAIEMHRMSILPNKQCSMHAHQFKHNAFLVLSGRLSIVVEKNDYALTDVTELGPGDFTTVPPGEYHRFVSHDEPVDAIEFYYVEPVAADDIVRKDCGGQAGA